MSAPCMTRPQQIAIALGDVLTAEALHERLMTALNFPSFYGCNWDAFWDAITGLVALPHVLRMEGWTQLATRLPEDARILKTQLTRMQALFPHRAPRLELA